MSLFELDVKEESNVIPHRNDPLDMSIAKQRFERYVDEVKDMQRRADAFVIDGPEANITASEMVLQATKLVKAVNSVVKNLIDEPDTYVKFVKSLGKTVTDPATAIKKGISAKLSAYDAKIKLEQRKKEEAARKAAAEFQKKLDEEAKKAGVEAPKVPEPVVPKQENTVTRTAEGSIYYRENWVGTVVDPKKVPPEYHYDNPVDQKKINQAVKAGVRKIPGVRIESVKTPITRT
jgi:hypothetical protein